MSRKEFTKATKKARYEHCRRVDGVPHCEYCGGTFSASNPPEYHHHKEAESGGDNSFENCRVIGAKCCHVKETGKFKTACAKADRIRDDHRGVQPRVKVKIKSRGFRQFESNVKQLEDL